MNISTLATDGPAARAGASSAGLAFDSTQSFQGVQQRLLDIGALEKLLLDLEATAEVKEVIPKFGRNSAMATQGLSLQQGRELFLSEKALGLQLRYVAEGAEWWDLFLRVGRKVKLVRAHPCDC